MENEIRYLFYAGIKQFALINQLPVAWPNKSFEPAIVDEYLRVSTLTVPPNVFGINGASAYVWLIQVSIFVRDETGELASIKYSNNLRNAFPTGFQFIGSNHSFMVMRPATIISPIPLDGWNTTPVQFRIQTIH